MYQQWHVLMWSESNWTSLCQSALWCCVLVALSFQKHACWDYLWVVKYVKLAAESPQLNMRLCLMIAVENRLLVTL